MDPERQQPPTRGTTQTTRSKGACRLKTPSSVDGYGDLVGSRKDAEGFAGSDNAHLHSSWQKGYEKLRPPSEAFSSCETPVYLLPAGELGLRGAAAFAGAASQLPQPRGEVLTCPDVLIPSRKEGRAGGAGSRAKPKWRSRGRRVGMGGGASLLPGKQRTPSTKPSRGLGQGESPESHATEQRTSQADPQRGAETPSPGDGAWGHLGDVNEGAQC